MKALKVEPHKKPELVDINDDLETLQAQVDGYIETYYPFEDEVCLICNDEGKINGMELNRPIYDDNGEMMDIIAGNFLVVGCHSEEHFDDITDVDGKDFSGKYMRMFETPVSFMRLNGNIVALPDN